MNHLTEKEILKHCLNNEDQGLEVLYKCFSARMFGICIRYTSTRMEAEDLLHDGFIRVMNNLKQFRGDGSLEGWMRRIMVTTAINTYHRNKKTTTDEISDSLTETTAFNDSILSELSANELLELINNLPDGYRMVFNLFAIEGYKHSEIAEMLAISESTSKTQFLKARKQLQYQIKNKLHGESVYERF